MKKKGKGKGGDNDEASTSKADKKKPGKGKSKKRDDESGGSSRNKAAGSPRSGTDASSFPTAAAATLSLSQDLWLDSGSVTEPVAGSRKGNGDSESESDSDSDSSEEEKAAKRPPKLLIPMRSLKGGAFIDVRDKMKASIEAERVAKQTKSSESEEETDED
jgi:hypothetical protein